MPKEEDKDINYKKRKEGKGRILVGECNTGPNEGKLYFLK